MSPPPGPAPTPLRLREAHAHIPMHGQALSMLKLDACTSLGGVPGPDRTRSGTNPRLNMGVGPRRAGRRLGRGAAGPPRDQLDAITPTLAPCCVMSFDHHALVAEHRRDAGGWYPRGRRPDPGDGDVCRDQRGAPTGLLLEAAAYQVWNAAPRALRPGKAGSRQGSGRGPRPPWLCRDPRPAQPRLARPRSCAEDG